MMPAGTQRLRPSDPEPHARLWVPGSGAEGPGTTAPAPPREPEVRTRPAGQPDPERELRGWLRDDDDPRCHVLVHRTLRGYRHTLCGLPVEPPQTTTHKWTGRCPYEAPSYGDCVAAVEGMR